MTVLAISVGDPAGVGPAVSVAAAAGARERARLVLFGDGVHLERALAARGCPVDSVDAAGDLGGNAGSVGVADVGRWDDQIVTDHRPSAAGGAAQVAMLTAVLRAALDRRADAVVTGPVSKEAIVLSGEPFEGHTEWFAEGAGLAADDVTMLFLGPRLVVGLVTTHRAIRAVPDAITVPRVERTLVHLAQALTAWRGRPPAILEVCGLNPHAGEGGLFGREEIDVVGPALRRLDGQPLVRLDGVLIRGPSPSEAVFRRAAAGAVDGVVAMFHDQATIASKLLDFGRAVNVTWGLPFLRTSVDHGVAYDAARTATADASGMAAAIEMALALADGAPVPP